MVPRGALWLVAGLLLPGRWVLAEVQGDCVDTNQVKDCGEAGRGERTFVMIKPDGVQRGLVGEVLGRLERKGLQLEGIKMVQAGRGLVESHYIEHKDRPFFDSLVSYVTSGPVVAMVWRGEAAVRTVRRLLGSTDPLEAAGGTIRGDLALSKVMNLCHASDSAESAAREVGLWFQPEELVEWRPALAAWTHSGD
jgi:nucleoside-diphosphate kinase